MEMDKVGEEVALQDYAGPSLHKPVLQQILQDYAALFIASVFIGVDVYSKFILYWRLIHLIYKNVVTLFF
jgi:hypothetical protein